MEFTYTATRSGKTMDEAEAIAREEIAKRVALGFKAPTASFAKRRSSGSAYTRAATYFAVLITGDV